MRQDQITVYLPRDLLDRLDNESERRRGAEARARGRGGVRGRRSDVVRDALLAYLPPPRPPALSPAVEEVGL